MRFARSGRLLPTQLLLMGCSMWACDSRAPSDPEPEARRDSPAITGLATAKGTAAPNGHEDEAPRPMMVEFSRDYCTPCQIMEPWVDEVANEHPSIDVVTINVDRERNEHLGSYFKVSAVPGLVFVDSTGTILKRWDGLASKEKMRETLRELGWAP